MIPQGLQGRDRLVVPFLRHELQSRLILPLEHDLFALGCLRPGVPEITQFQIQGGRFIIPAYVQKRAGDLVPVDLLQDLPARGGLLSRIKVSAEIVERFRGLIVLFLRHQL